MCMANHLSAYLSAPSQSCQRHQEEEEVMPFCDTDLVLATSRGGDIISSRAYYIIYF